MGHSLESVNSVPLQGFPEPLVLSLQGSLCVREVGEEEAPVQKLSRER